MVFLISFSTSSFFSLKYKGNAASTRPVMTKLFLLAVSSVSSVKFVHCALKHIQFIPVRFCASNGAELIIIIIIIEKIITRRLAACTQAVVILRSTSYIATELNVLHLKSYEIQSNRYMCAIVPLIAFLGIDL